MGANSSRKFASDDAQDEPQRGCASKPRVDARHEHLPWVNARKRNEPQRGSGPRREFQGARSVSHAAATPLGLGSYVMGNPG